MSEENKIKKVITKYIENILSVKGKNKIENSKKSIIQYDVGEELIMKLLYNENRDIVEIEFFHTSGFCYFAFVFPTNPSTDMFKNIIDHIDHIDKMYDKYIVSNIEIRDYYLIGDELVGVGSNNNVFLFSFKRGFLESMKMD